VGALRVHRRVIGGPLWLLAGTRGSPEDERVAAARRFSALATVSVAVVVVTGTWRALDAIGLDQLEALVNTDYGRLFLIKLGGRVRLTSEEAASAARARVQMWGDVPECLRPTVT
jgi:putative copper export protein